MASSSMASAACGFVLAQNMASNATPLKPNMLLFSSKNNRSSRLVVRAAEGSETPAAAAPPADAPAEAKPKAAKPPPVGPPRGSKVSFFNHNIIIHLNQLIFYRYVIS